MRCFILLAIVLPFTFLTGCRKHRATVSPPPASTRANTLVGGTVIKSAGAWEHSDGRENRTLTTNSYGRGIQWKYRSIGRNGNNTLSSSISLNSPADPWFIYVESPEELWFFDGGGQLSYRKWDRSDESGYAIYDGILKASPENVPSGLIPHLPPDLQKLFPAEATKPRPSI